MAWQARGDLRQMAIFDGGGGGMPSWWRQRGRPVSCDAGSAVSHVSGVVS